MIKPREYLEKITRISAKDPTRLNKHRLDRNDRNQPFSGEFITNIREKISGDLIMSYPELDSIYIQISNWLNIDKNKLLINAGSEQVIKAIFETYVRPGDEILLHFPGYAMYFVYGKLFRAKAKIQSINTHLTFNWDEFINKITSKTRLVVIENPNGFVGTAPHLKILKQIVEKAKLTNTIVLVDEAYYHFHKETAADWIDKYDNLLVVRTFSKAFGLAGVRVGYLLSQQQNIQNVKKVLPAYEINGISALIVSEALTNYKEAAIYVNDTATNRTYLRKKMAELEIQTSNSVANFIVAKIGEKNIHTLRKRLLNKNILIRRPFRESYLKDWVRLSTAPIPIQNELLAELKQVLNNDK